MIPGSTENIECPGNIGHFENVGYSGIIILGILKVLGILVVLAIYKKKVLGS